MRVARSWLSGRMAAVTLGVAAVIGCTSATAPAQSLTGSWLFVAMIYFTGPGAGRPIVCVDSAPMRLSATGSVVTGSYGWSRAHCTTTAGVNDTASFTDSGGVTGTLHGDTVEFAMSPYWPQVSMSNGGAIASDTGLVNAVRYPARSARIS